MRHKALTVLVAVIAHATPPAEADYMRSCFEGFPQRVIAINVRVFSRSDESTRDAAGSHGRSFAFVTDSQKLNT